MKLKVCKRFFDLKAGIMREVGEVFEVDETRAEQLLADHRGLVKKCSTVKRSKKSK